MIAIPAIQNKVISSLLGGGMGRQTGACHLRSNATHSGHHEQSSARLLEGKSNPARRQDGNRAPRGGDPVVADRSLLLKAVAAYSVLTRTPQHAEMWPNPCRLTRSAFYSRHRLK
jgi:hypothetical protein